MSVSRVFLKFSSSLLLAALVFGVPLQAAASNIGELSQNARQAFSSGDFQVSYDLLTQVLKSGEIETAAKADAFLNRSLVAQKMGQYELAVADYNEALALDLMPNDMRAKTLQSRGHLQHKLTRYGAAVEDFTGALLLDSSYAQAYFGRANALRESGQYLFALSDYDRALRYDYSEKHKVYYGQALAYEGLQLPEKQRAALLIALVEDATFQPAVDALAKLQAATTFVQQPVENSHIAQSLDVNPMAQTQVVKLALPKAIEPPPALLVEAHIATDEGAALVATAEVSPPKIEIPDEVVASRVEVTSVPKLPKKLGKTLGKPIVVKKISVKLEPKSEPIVADPVQVGSIDKAASAKHRGWVVQLASAPSEIAALGLWKTMQRKFPVVSGQDAIVVRADLGEKGIFYRLRLVGFDQQAEAAQACATLKSAGLACYISKANG